MSVRRRQERDPKTGEHYEVWIVDLVFQHPDGRRTRIKKKSPVQTRRGAQEYERQVRGALLDGTHGGKEKRVPTLLKFSEEFLNTYALSNNKPSEVEAKRSALRAWLVPHFGKRKLDEIGVRDVEALKAKMLGAGRSAKRVNNTLTVLGRMLKYAVEAELLETSPRIKFVRVPPQDFDFLDADEYARLLEAAAAAPMLRAAILVAGDAGLRSGEVRALKWPRVDLVAGQLMVAETFWRRHLGSPKGGRISTVPLTDALAKALGAIRHLRGEFVFCHADGRPWSRDWADRALKAACRRAGLREVTWHVLRHSFCSALAMRGAPPKAIMELARHTSLMVTQRYMHLGPDARREAIALLNSRPSRPAQGPAALVASNNAARTRT